MSELLKCSERLLIREAEHAWMGLDTGEIC